MPRDNLARGWLSSKARWLWRPGCANFLLIRRKDGSKAGVRLESLMLVMPSINDYARTPRNARLGAVESAITTLESEFLTDVVFPDGRTVRQWLVPQADEAYATGRMPPMLGAGYA